MANYTETFTGQTTGANSTTHTNRWATETTISVENPALLEQDDRVLQFAAGDSGYQLQSMDSVDGDANRDNSEILCRFRVTTDDDNSAWLVARASGSGGSETGYGLHVGSGATVALGRLNAGSYTSLDTIDADRIGESPWASFLGDTFTYTPPNIWLWARLRVNGTGATVTVNGRVWVDGQEEPTDWTLSASDTSASRITAAGWSGFGRFVTTGVTYLDMMAVGTNGDTAVAAAGTDPVRVTTVSANTLQQNEATPVRVTSTNAQVLHQNEATPVRVTSVNAQVIYTRIPDRIGAPQTIIATIGTGFD
jgi:hypothetical protein